MSDVKEAILLFITNCPTKTYRGGEVVPHEYAMACFVSQSSTPFIENVS